MTFNINNEAEALQFLADDQDEKLVKLVTDKLDSHEWNIDEAEAFKTWEVRGDYRTLLVISDDEGVVVSDHLMDLWLDQ